MPTNAKVAEYKRGHLQHRVGTGQKKSHLYDVHDSEPLRIRRI